MGALSEVPRKAAIQVASNSIENMSTPGHDEQMVVHQGHVF